MAQLQSERLSLAGELLRSHISCIERGRSITIREPKIQIGNSTFGESQESEEAPMSNLTATVQELYAAFGRGDLPAILSKLADDVVWEYEAPAVIKLSGIRHGVTETRGFFEAIVAENIDPKLTITEYVESGDTVMTIGRYSATAEPSGRKFDTPIAHYWKFRDGKVIRYVGFANTGAVAEAMQPLSAGASR
jgi:ketosteroid isomerase-like protein